MKSEVMGNNENGEGRLKQLEKLYSTSKGSFINNDGQRKVFSVETLLDILLVLFDECNTPLLKREKHVADFLEIAKPVATRVKHLRLKRDDFETLNVIGRGAFGEVAVVQMSATNQVYAMKTLNKWEMLKRAETACFREERDVLAFGDGRWVTKLHYAFQDDSNLYFVMDYYSGGDLLTLLSKYEDHIPEEMLKFYAAEMILAIDSVHKMKYVHRDIKPDNILIDVTGHIRLADFGSCLKIDTDGFVKCTVAIGTPDYISPEILQAMEDGRGQYGKECDWWSLGICCFELIYGETPFYAESLVETYSKIMAHKTKFKFPDDCEVSDDFKNLMSRLICDSSERLGRDGLSDFRSHPFFNEINWENIFECTPPYVPDLDGPTDVSNFDVDELTEAKTQEFAPPPTHQAFTGHHLPFIGFTFSKDSTIADNVEGSILTRDDENSQTKGGDFGDLAAVEQKLKIALKENSELQKKLEDALKSSTKVKSRNSMNEGTKSATVELVAAKKKILDAESKVKRLQQDNGELEDSKRALENETDELNGKVKELERSKKLITQDKKYLEQEMKDLKDKLTNAQTDYRESQGQKKQAMEEFSELNDKLAEVRSQKMKLSRLVREKEEEIESSMSKLDQVRQDLRASEKSKRELVAQSEDIQLEKHKESKLRSKAEAQVRQLEEELQVLKTKKSSTLNTDSNDRDMEIIRLKAEMERTKQEYEENIEKEKQKSTYENKRLKESISEFEKNNSQLAEEVKSLSIKLSKKEKANSEEENAVFNDYKNATLRSKNELQRENAKLSAEIEKLTAQLEKGIASQKKLEEDLRNVAEKRDAISHWEGQIKEIIQMVSDEKEARGFLQALAEKMKAELDALKRDSSVAAAGAMGKNWQTRRSQRLDKQEMLSLQSKLNMELQAKLHLSKELDTLKINFNQTERKNQEQVKRIIELEQQLTSLQREKEKLSGGDFNFSFLNFMSSSDVDFSTQFSTQTSTPAMEELREEDEVADEVDVKRLENKEAGNSIQDSYSVIVTASAKTPQPQEKERTDILVKGTTAPDISSTPSVSEICREHPVKMSPNEKETGHKFVSKTFVSPSKCHNCSSIMFGHTRQGVICDVCSYQCHMHCRASKDAPKLCPIPKQLLTSRPLGIDPKSGTGTAYEAFVRIPKYGGVKRGWMRAFAVVCDFKIVIYDCAGEKQANNTIIGVIDMRDEEFSVSPVLASDVIHANKRDIPCIFKVSVFGLNAAGSLYKELFLCDTEVEKVKWIGMLQELVQLYNKTHGKDRKNTIQGREVCSNDAGWLKTVICATIVNADRLLFGTEEGLFAYELTKEKLHRIDEKVVKKDVLQVEAISEEQLIIVLTGRRQVRLYPMSVVDGVECESIKVQVDTKDTKALSFSTGTTNQGVSTCLCIAMRKIAYIYELNRTKSRHRECKKVTFPWACQWMGMLGGRLVVGFQNPCMFAYNDIMKDSTQLEKLIIADDPIYGMNMEALCAVDITDNEYLLCFKTLAIYVHLNGTRSRTSEIAWPSPVNHIACNKPYLLVYTDRGVDAFDSRNGSWIQTLQIPKTMPLYSSGVLNLLATPEYQSIIYIKQDNIEDEIHIKSTQGKKAVAAIYRLKQSKKRLSFKTRESLKVEEADLVSKLISAPSNFHHLSHMGPGSGLQILQDIPGQGKGDDKLSVSNLSTGAPVPGRPISSYSSQQSQESPASIRQRSHSMEIKAEIVEMDPDTISSNSSTSSTSGQTSPSYTDEYTR